MFALYPPQPSVVGDPAPTAPTPATGGGLTGLVGGMNDRFKAIKAYQSDPSRGGAANWQAYKRMQAPGWKDQFRT